MSPRYVYGVVCRCQRNAFFFSSTAGSELALTDLGKSIKPMLTIH